MTTRAKLTVVRWLHAAVFVVMVGAVGVVLYSGIAGVHGIWLVPAIGLVGVEGVALLANRFECPLTSLAREYGAEEGHVFDVFMSRRFARVTFGVAAALLAIGIVLLLVRG